MKVTLELTSEEFLELQAKLDINKCYLTAIVSESRESHKETIKRYKELRQSNILENFPKNANLTSNLKQHLAKKGLFLSERTLTRDLDDLAQKGLIIKEKYPDKKGGYRSLWKK